MVAVMLFQTAAHTHTACKYEEKKRVETTKGGKKNPNPQLDVFNSDRVACHSSYRLPTAPPHHQRTAYTEHCERKRPRNRRSDVTTKNPPTPKRCPVLRFGLLLTTFGSREGRLVD